MFLDVIRFSFDFRYIHIEYWSVILFTGGRGGLPQCMLGYHTPQDQAGTPPQDQTSPRTRQAAHWNQASTYRDQAGTLRDQTGTPPGPVPPEQNIMGETDNERAVCILRECNLVNETCFYAWLKLQIFWWWQWDIEFAVDTYIAFCMQAKKIYAPEVWTYLHLINDIAMSHGWSCLVDKRKARAWASLQIDAHWDRHCEHVGRCITSAAAFHNRLKIILFCMFEFLFT